MAVYTEVSFDDAAPLLAQLGLGQLTHLQGITSGIENTNYFADTTQGRFVLTRFERQGVAELPVYLHPAFPCPGPGATPAARFCSASTANPPPWSTA